MFKSFLGGAFLFLRLLERNLEMKGISSLLVSFHDGWIGLTNAALALATLVR